MSLLRNKLRKLLPRFSKEANKIKHPEARRRWMNLKKITESNKTIASACRFYGMSEDSYSKWGLRVLKHPFAKSLESRSRKPHRSPRKTKPHIEKKVLKIRRVEPYLGSTDFRGLARGLSMKIFKPKDILLFVLDCHASLFIRSIWHRDGKN